MYRKRNNSIGFSFTRFIQNAVPNLAGNWEPGTIEISLQRRDMLYASQISKGRSPACLELDEEAFYVAGCCDRERQSQRIYVALLKNGVLVEPRGESETGPRGGAAIDTTKIGPRFIHQLAFISQTSQKHLINTLFFWEEEVHRLRKLDGEEEELSALVEQAGGESTAELDRIRFARERVRMKRRQLPSQRDPRVENDEDGIVASGFQVPPAETARQQRENDHEPPAYVRV